MARQRFGKNTVVKFFGGEIRIKPPSLALREFDDKVDLIKGRMKDVRPALDAFGRYLIEKHIPEQFKKQGVPRRWRSLSPRYAEQKRRDGFGHKGILERTGALKRGFSYTATPRTLQINNRVMVSGKSLFHIHQAGSRANNLPSRKMLRINKKERDQFYGLLEDYLGS